jgi:hypothetical protein
MQQPKEKFAPPIGPMADFDDPDPREHDMRWLGDDGANVYIEVQGSLVCLAYRQGPRRCPPTVKRGKCLPFSAASRLRMFKLINRVDWSNQVYNTFFTATWPDRDSPVTMVDVTRARSRFHRDLELECGYQVAGIWRKEYQDRKSGEQIGRVYPHIHEILFGTPYIDLSWWRHYWAMAIGTNEYASVRINGVRNAKMAARYIADYLGKTPDPAVIGHLGIAAYLNSGRAWGVYRRDLLPLCDSVVIRVPPNDLVRRIRRIAREHWPRCPDNEREGFTLFGDAAIEIRELLDRYVAFHRRIDTIGESDGRGKPSACVDPSGDGVAADP